MRVTEADVLAAIRHAKATQCLVPGCGRPRYSRNGYCNAHRFRARVHGDPQPDKPLRLASYGDATCAAEGCKRRPMARNLCPLHYRRMRERAGA